MKRLEILGLKDNSGKINWKRSDEKNADACNCGWSCYLPDFIRNDPNRAPTCFIELNDWDCDDNTSCDVANRKKRNGFPTMEY